MLSQNINRRQFLQQGGALLVTAPMLLDATAAESLIQEPGSLENLLSQAQIRRLLGRAMSQGGEFAELFLEVSRGFGLRLQESKLRSASLGYSLGVGIRVLSGERTGYAYSDDLSNDALAEAATVAAHIASGHAQPGPWNVTHEAVRNLYDIRVPPGSVGIDEKVVLVQRADAAGRQADPRVKRMIVSYGEKNRQILIANTLGQLKMDRQSNQNIYAVAFLEDDQNNKQSAFFGDGGRVGMEFWTKVTPEDLAKEAVRQAAIKMEAADAPSGEMPVVINGKYGGVLLHEAIGHGLEADFNRKQLSKYSGKLGERIAPEIVTIEDTGEWDAKEWGTLNLDDEGIKTNRTVLVDKGILTQYMQDRLNAGLMNAGLTGNGRRESFRHMPMPRMTNTILHNGSHDPDEIFSTVDNGFYAKIISNGQVDISGGDFMFFVEEGYLIEKGKVTRPVKGATLIGNGPDVLSKVEMIGNDFAMAPASFVCGKSGQSVPVGMGMPTIKISKMTVGGTAV